MTQQENTKPYALRPMRIDEFDGLFQHLAQDFPRNELPPKVVMRRLITRGITRAWIMEQKDRQVAYAIAAEADGAVLITHLAVYAGQRGGGIGSKLMALLADAYAHATRLIVEVEHPDDAKNAQELAQRQRRIAFYQRAGYVLYPHIPYAIWRVRMLLMVQPIGGAPLPDDDALRADLRGIYARIMSPVFMHMLEI